MKTTTTGFAVRGDDGKGYYDMNGIGDWSLAGDIETCSIFGTVDEAVEAMADADCDDDYEIVHISRTVDVTIGERAEIVKCACGHPKVKHDAGFPACYYCECEAFTLPEASPR